MEPIKGKNPFFEQLKKYEGKEVTVHLKTGGQFTGKLAFTNFLSMNFIVKGKDGDYVVRDDLSYMFIPKGE